MRGAKCGVFMGCLLVACMKAALTLICMTRMKLSPDNCSSGVRGPRIAALCNRPSRRPNSFSIIAASLVVLVRQGGFQVERNDCRLRVTSLFDFVVEVVEAFFGLAQQQHRRTVGSERLGGSGTDATAGAGDQNDPAFKQVGAGNVVKHAGQSSGNGADGAWRAAIANESPVFQAGLEPFCAGSGSMMLKLKLPCGLSSSWKNSSRDRRLPSMLSSSENSVS